MDTVLSGLKWKGSLVYLDDVVVFVSKFDELLRRLRSVLAAIKTAGLTLKPSKCRFAYGDLKFLGHVGSARSVSPDPAKTSAVTDFPKPSDKKAFRRFLGLCAYYRRFVRDFAQISAPLTHLTKDDVQFQWEKEQKQAFDELKRRLQSPPILGHFDQSAETEIHTDASNTGIGAVLFRRQEGTERVIAYASRALPKAEQIIQRSTRNVLQSSGR